MMISHARPKSSPLAGRLGVVALGMLCPTLAHAHFTLEAPACYSQQGTFGSPQKSAPCGQADPGMPPVLTGMTTTYRQGQTITVTINEKIYHPGHYRVAIAADQASLPADPPVTAGATPCGSTTIAATPVLPVVADGVLLHMSSFTGPQSVTVTLPPGLTCTNCTLQVTEFMSNHPLNVPGGCFYHHCATISILPASDGGTGADGGPVTDGGMTSDGGARSDGGTPADGGPVADLSGPVADLSGPVADLSGPVADLSGPDTADAAMSPPPPPMGCSYPIGRAPTSAALAAGLLALGLLVRRRRSATR